MRQPLHHLDAMGNIIITHSTALSISVVIDAMGRQVPATRGIADEQVISPAGGGGRGAIDRAGCLGQSRGSEGGEDNEELHCFSFRRDRLSLLESSFVKLSKDLNLS